MLWGKGRTGAKAESSPGGPMRSAEVTLRVVWRYMKTREAHGFGLHVKGELNRALCAAKSTAGAILSMRVEGK